MSAHYVGLNGVVFPHATLALMVTVALVSYVRLLLATVALLGVCAVGTHKSSCTTRPITPFFILEAFGTQRVTGHVITPEPFSAGR
jgi:hypothetical protein